MEANRRNFLTSAVPVALAIPLGSLVALVKAQSGRPTLPPQDPMNPRPSMPPPPDDPFHVEPPKIDPKQVLIRNKREIQEGTQKLFLLAGELKEQVNKTDSAAVLSLPLVQKAEEIEKLAKQIKNLARGS